MSVSPIIFFYLVCLVCGICVCVKHIKPNASSENTFPHIQITHYDNACRFTHVYLIQLDGLLVFILMFDPNTVTYCIYDS